MVVTPQIFHHRLIIGTLIVTILGLTAYSVYSYKELKEQKEFLTQEKKSAESELSRIISRYDTLITENEDFKHQLYNAKQKTINLLDRLKYQEASVSLLSKYRAQIQELHEERSKFIQMVSTLKEQNSQLQTENYNVITRLDEQTEHNTLLSERNLLLAENLKKGSAITANSVKAKAFKTRSSGKIIETKKAHRTDGIEVCFTLPKNTLAKGGEKDFYIQILDPNRNVIGDKLSEKFGNFTLIYSKKATVNYANDVLDVCVKAKAGTGEKGFTKGIYFVNIFRDKNQLGSTQIVLN